MLRSYQLSHSEFNLVMIVREIEYGEIGEIEVSIEEQEHLPLAITDKERQLIEYVRNGHQAITLLTVHQSEPQYAEIDFERMGFRCRKKIKFD